MGKDESVKGLTKSSWIYAIVLAAVIGFVGEAVVSFGGTSGQFNLGFTGCWLAVPVLPYILILIYRLITTVAPSRAGSLGKRMNLTNLTYIYVVGVASSFFIAGTKWPWWTFHFAADRYLDPIADSIIPWIIAPNRDVAVLMVRGGVPVPWLDWLPSILFWWGIEIASILQFTSITLILRRSFIDIERLPFPQTMVVHELMTRTAGDRRWGKPFIIGIILGLAFQIPIWLGTTFTWFPDIYGWRTNTCGTGAEYVTSASPLFALVGLSTWQKNPAYIALFYLAPLSILLSTWFFWLVFIIIGTQILYTFGYYTGTATTSGCGRVWCSTPDTGLGFAAPTYWISTSSVGGGVGIFIWYLIINRSYVVQTLRLSFHKMGEKTAELEGKEPMTYRNAYLLLIGSFILSVILWMAPGLSLASAIALPLTAILCFSGSTLIYSRVGHIGYAAGTDYGAFLMRFIFPNVPASYPNVSFSYLLPIYASVTYCSDGPAFGTGGSMFSLTSSFRMADLTGVDNRSVFSLWLIAAVVTPLEATASALYFIHAFGMTRLTTVSFSCTSMSPTAGCWAFHTNLEQFLHDSNMIAGFLIVGALTFLHARYVWFPFEPIGFVLGTSRRTMLDGVWLPALIAWVLKTMTMRVGGSKAFENYGVPVASGFMAGYVIVVFAGVLLVVYRFFFPF
jgi:hypothetical protein